MIIKNHQRVLWQPLKQQQKTFEFKIAQTFCIQLFLKIFY